MSDAMTASTAPPEGSFLAQLDKWDGKDPVLKAEAGTANEPSCRPVASDVKHRNRSGALSPSRTESANTPSAHLACFP